MDGASWLMDQSGSYFNEIKPFPYAETDSGTFTLFHSVITSVKD